MPMSVQDHDAAFETGEISDAAQRSKPDGAANPAGEAGWYLERERVRRGETLETISEAIGIHPYHLGAIESGDLTRLPVRLEALQMIGIYAQHLGFDPEPLVMHYAQFLPKPPLAPEASHPADPAPLSSAKVIRFGRLPSLPKFSIHSFPGGTGGVVASCLAAVMLFAGTSYILQPGSDMAPTEQVADAIDEMPPAASQEQPADVAISEEPMPDTEVPGLKPAAEDTAGPGLDGLTEFLEQNPAVAEQKPGTPLPQITASIDKPAESGNGRVFGEEAGKSRLVLRAKGSVVVRIEDAKGNVVMTQVLRAGDRYRVPAKDGLIAIARDGGLIAYEIDGKEKGVLGPAGEILVGRSLDIKSLEKKG